MLGHDESKLQLLQRGGRLRGDRHGRPRHSTHRQFPHTIGPPLLLGVDGSMMTMALDLFGAICPGAVGLNVHVHVRSLSIEKLARVDLATEAR